LYLLFTAGDSYSNSEWEIEVPNTRNSNYTTLKNAYTLAKTQAQNAIDLAKNSLDLAEDEFDLATAPARNEESIQALSAVSQAEARVAAIDARMSDRSIVAPFPGIITKISITKGESASINPVITILGDNAFVLKARVPEIDITKIKNGQTVKAIFDANDKETLTGQVSYISPIATQIDGVAYFEITIKLDQSPEWLRAGLNADIDIVVEKKENVLRIPKRFVIEDTDKNKVVLLLKNNKVSTSTVTVNFTGNDSFVEITGLEEGSVVVAP
jgi:HlyD family secretion protein